MVLRFNVILTKTYPNIHYQDDIYQIDEFINSPSITPRHSIDNTFMCQPLDILFRINNSIFQGGVEVGVEVEVEVEFLMKITMKYKKTTPIKNS